MTPRWRDPQWWLLLAWCVFVWWPLRVLAVIFSMFSKHKKHAVY